MTHWIQRTKTCCAIGLAVLVVLLAPLSVLAEEQKEQELGFVLAGSSGGELILVRLSDFSIHTRYSLYQLYQHSLHRFGDYRNGNILSHSISLAELCLDTKQVLYEYSPSLLEVVGPAVYSPNKEGLAAMLVLSGTHLKIMVLDTGSDRAETLVAVALDESSYPYSSPAISDPRLTCAWGLDDMIYFSAHGVTVNDATIYAVPAAGGTPRPLGAGLYPICAGNPATVYWVTENGFMKYRSHDEVLKELPVPIFEQHPPTSRPAITASGRHIIFAHSWPYLPTRPLMVYDTSTEAVIRVGQVPAAMETLVWLSSPP